MEAPKASGPSAGDSNPGIDYENRIMMDFIRAMRSLRFAVFSGPNKIRYLVAPGSSAKILYFLCVPNSHAQET